MRERGCTFREIAVHFGFKDKYVLKEFFKRERAKQETSSEVVSREIS